MKENHYVYFELELVGTIERKRDATLSFSYSKDWPKSGKSFSLSPILSMASDGPFDNRQTRSFFENLLPEGKVRERLEKLTGKSLTDSYQFLEKFGVDCAGAIVISSSPDLTDQLLEEDYNRVDLEELAKAHTSNQNLMVHVMEKHQGRFSLAGAQDKVPVVIKGNEVLVAKNGPPTTHILKPPHYDKAVKNSVHNEYFCMKLAKSCGLNVPEVDVIEAGIPFYTIERYDRVVRDEKIYRLHQVDFCQAQNYLAQEKYEEDRGPSLKENYFCIRNNSSRVIPDTKQFMQWIWFNLLIGNNDCHSKNLSFLLENGKTRLAPFYDILCTSIYPQYAPTFPYRIGGKANWGQLSTTDLQREIISWGLDKNPDLLSLEYFALKKILEKLLGDEVKKFCERFPKNKTAGRIKTEVEKRMRSFDRRL